MGLTGRFLWVSSYSNKQWRSLFWRVRAAVKRALKSSNGRGRRRGRKGGAKQHLKFQYDPSSYALNFDDGCKPLGEEEIINNGHISNGFRLVKLQDHFPSNSTSTPAWVYVFWVKIY